MTDQPPPFDEVAEEIVAASPTPTPVPVWAGLCTGTGLALVAVAALVFLGIVAQGLAVEQDTSVWYRLGIAFLRNLDASPVGLMLIVAVGLVAVPILTGAVGDRRATRQESVALGVAAAIAVLVAMGAVLGVITRLHFDTAPGQEITTVTRRVLATFVVRNLGPALVAFGATVALVRARVPVAVTPSPYGGSGGPGTDPAEPGAGAGPA
jgi:hypothetical protein